MPSANLPPVNSFNVADSAASDTTLVPGTGMTDVPTRNPSGTTSVVAAHHSLSAPGYARPPPPHPLGADAGGPPPPLATDLKNAPSGQARRRPQTRKPEPRGLLHQCALLRARQPKARVDSHTCDHRPHAR